MLNRTKLIVAIGAASVALASATSFAREASEGPRGADNRPGNIRMAHGADDATKVTTTATPAADNHGGKTTPDDNNKNKGDAGNRGGGNGGGNGGADDPAGHH